MLVPAREQQRELVAPQAEGLATLTQAGRHLRQDLVTGRMPVPVVDLLEVVDVEQDEVSAKPSSCALSRSCWSRSWKCRWLPSPVSGSVSARRIAFSALCTERW